MLPPPAHPKILTVTELTVSIKVLLETELPFVTVSGEISNLRQPYSGHIYFTFKDEKSQLKAVMFKPQQKYLSNEITDGLHVICRGRISVYEPRGDYQLIVDYIEFKGEGAQQYAFERLKKQLEKEGLFNKEIKKKLPALPERIAIITSPSGAALFDFLKVAENRFPSIPIEIMPARMQGKEAAGDIIDGLNILNERRSASIIVICRGGGSLEDLWPLNDEQLARTIHASNLPVVSAIGHEIDFTIADFVADHRSPTPTAAAEEIIPSQQDLKETIFRFQQYLIDDLKRQISDYLHLIQSHKSRLGDPRSMLAHFFLLLDYSQTAMNHALTNSLNHHRVRVNTASADLYKENPAQQLLFKKQWIKEQKRRLAIFIQLNVKKQNALLNQAVSLLEAVGPPAVLKRGYSILRTIPDGSVIQSSKQTFVGQSLEILLQQGKVECEVNKIYNNEK